MKQKNPRDARRPDTPSSRGRHDMLDADRSSRIGGGQPELSKHEVVAGDTLSSIARRYYGSDSRDDWMRIYRANREIIGDNPDVLRLGLTLEVPPQD